MMHKVAVTIEKPAGGAWRVTAGPSEDVAALIAGAKAQSVARGGGDGLLLVLSTVGIEKRFKVGQVKVAAAGRKGIA